MLGRHTHQPSQLSATDRHHAAIPIAIKSHVRLQGRQGSWTNLAGSPVASRHSKRDSCASLLFELEIDDEVEVSQRPSKGCLPDGLDFQCMPLREDERRLWQLAMQAREASLEENGRVNVQLFGQHLATYTQTLTWLRKGLGKGSKELSLSARHTFVVTELEGLGFYIVDPNYKDALAVSGSTSEYSALLAELPEVMVGSGEQLAAWLKLVHNEMAKCFSSRGIPLPPWREYNALVGMWLVSKAEDTLLEPLDPALSAPSAAAKAGVLSKAETTVAIFATEPDLAVVQQSELVGDVEAVTPRGVVNHGAALGNTSPLHMVSFGSSFSATAPTSIAASAAAMMSQHLHGGSQRLLSRTADEWDSRRHAARSLHFI